LRPRSGRGGSCDSKSDAGCAPDCVIALGRSSRRDPGTEDFRHDAEKTPKLRQTMPAWRARLPICIPLN